MTRSTSPSVNPTAIGWMLGLLVPVFGALVLGSPLQSQLRAMDAPAILVEGAPVVGALFGLVVLVVAIAVYSSYTNSAPDRPPVSRHFEDDSSRER